MSRRPRPPAGASTDAVSRETEVLRTVIREAHEAIQAIREERRAIRRERDELVQLVKEARDQLEVIVSRDVKTWSAIEAETRKVHQDAMREYWRHVADVSSTELVASLTDARDAVLEQIGRAVTLALRQVDPGRANGDFRVSLVAAPVEARAFMAPAGAIVRSGMEMVWEDGQEEKP